MKKIKFYDSKTPFEFHKIVVSNKRNSNAETVQSLESQIKGSFDNYQDLFAADNLQSLNASPYSASQAIALRDMYSYSAKAFAGLRDFYVIDSNGRKNDICPNCQIDTISSFDHFVPQAEYPEFSDNTLNLMPCCTTCNGHKNATWRGNGKRYYLNLFIDDIPTVQFLFANVSIIEGKPSVHFSISNSGKIDDDLYEKIYHHYTKLSLLHRFEDKSDIVITTLANDIQTYMIDLPDEIIIKRTKERACLDQKKYGTNYWKSVLKLSAIEDPDVLNYLKTCLI